MIRTNIQAFLWHSAGLLFSLLGILVVLGGLSNQFFMADPEGIPAAADAILHCIQNGDWDSLEQMVSGSPSLTPEIGEEGSAEKIIYYAYQQSLNWVCKEDFRIHGSFISQPVTLSCLNIRLVTDTIAEVLADPVASASFSEDQPQMLRSAAEQVLLTCVPIMEQEITLVFLRENGQWQLVPNAALQNLLSGFTAPGKVNYHAQ